MMKKGILLFSAFVFVFSSMAQLPCSFDNNQGDANSGYLIFFEGVTAYVYVDPSQDGALYNPGCGSTSDFVLTSVEWTIADAGWFDNPNPANGTAKFQFGIYKLDVDSNACAGVGENVWLSPEYTRTVQNTADSTDYFIPTGAISLDEPFFMTWKLLDWSGQMNQVMCPIWDGVARPGCRQFYSANDGANFVPHEEFFNSSFGWIDCSVNGYYEIEEFTEVQFIHASADGLAQTVDIRVNGEFPDSSFDNVNFMCSTSSILIPAGSNEITINPANSIDASSPIAAFSENYSDGDKQIGIIHGIASSSGYTPSSTETPLEISYINPAQGAANGNGDTDLIFFHAVTDVAEVDIDVQGGPTIGTGIAYGESGSYVGIDTDTEEILIQEAGLELQNYILPLDELELDNLASVIVLAGFDNVSANSNGQPFSCYISSPSGGCLEVLDFINSTEDYSYLEVGLYPNPAQNFVIFDNQALTGLSSIIVYDVLGNLVKDFSLRDNRNRLDISDLQNGYYTFLYSDLNGNILGLSKIVKTK